MERELTKEQLEFMDEARIKLWKSLPNVSVDKMMIINGAHTAGFEAAMTYNEKRIDALLSILTTKLPSTLSSPDFAADLDTIADELAQVGFQATAADLRDKAGADPGGCGRGGRWGPVTSPLERHAELDKIINAAWAEREGLVLPIIDQFAPFQPDDVIRCEDQTLTVIAVWFDGLNKTGQPEFFLEGLIHRKDGSVGQRSQKVFNKHLSQWRKAESYTGSLNDVAKLAAWQNAAAPE